MKKGGLVDKRFLASRDQPHRIGSDDCTFAPNGATNSVKKATGSCYADSSEIPPPGPTSLISKETCYSDTKASSFLRNFGIASALTHITKPISL